MNIDIPGYIDLRHPEKYILYIGIDLENFSFSLSDPHNPSDSFYFSLYKEDGQDMFEMFKELVFEHEFFSFSFLKIYIINYGTVFTYIPEILFEEKNKNAYIDLLFSDRQERILFHPVNDLKLVVVHSLEEKVYEFLHRTFINAFFIHYTTAVITYLNNRSNLDINTKRMFLIKNSHSIDIYCFDKYKLLLVNHYFCPTGKDAVYYPLFVWKQLKYDQLKDLLYIMGNDKELTDELKKYIYSVIPLESEAESQKELKIEKIPIEMCAMV